MRRAKHLYASGRSSVLVVRILTAGSQSVGIRLNSVSKANLCVTEGAIEELPGQRLSVNVAKMRAYVNAYTQPLAEVRFTYLGGTPNEAPLASGEMRRQFGLKLRAQDACNLEGSVGPDALAFDGPAGVRSDNARLQFESSDWAAD